MSVGGSGRRFLLDQSADARLVAVLRSLGHDAVRIGADFPPGLPDEDVLALAWRDGRVLITDDRDFGELVFRHGQPYLGVIYLRLGEYAELATKIERLEYVLAHHAAELDRFLVVSRTRVRVRQS
jgi:predicted nuclease of predicted toxin-antitoxin system